MTRYRKRLPSSPRRPVLGVARPVPDELVASGGVDRHFHLSRSSAHARAWTVDSAGSLELVRYVRGLRARNAHRPRPLPFSSARRRLAMKQQLIPPATSTWTACPTWWWPTRTATP